MITQSRRSHTSCQFDCRYAIPSPWIKGKNWAENISTW